VIARRILLGAGNTYVVAYALDAALSTVETLVRLGLGFTQLGPLRNFVAEAVIVASILGLPLLALTPRLPLSVFLPLIVSTLWFLIGAPPVGSAIGGEAYAFAVCAIQLGFAAFAFARIRSSNGGDGWLLRARSFEGPLFSARYTLTYAAALFLLAIPLSLLSLVSVAASEVESRTSGFVTFDSGGVSLDDRVYVRNEREIRLVGMMHLGDPGVYRDIFTSFVSESTLVLAEGVSDEHGVLEGPISYEGVARALGLEQQQYITEYLSQDSKSAPQPWPEVRRADLDTSDFAPETIVALKRVGRVWASDTPLRELVELVRRADTEPELWTSLMEDILVRRNEHLIGEIDSSLGEYERIVIPWGALHLPAIENAISERGFERVSSVRHRLITWATLFAALTQ
jgi:hypothetical protein